MDDEFLELDLLDIFPYIEVYTEIYNVILDSAFFTVDILKNKDEKILLELVSEMNETINIEFLQTYKSTYRKIMRKNIEKINKDRIKKGSLILREFYDDEPIEIKGISYFKTNNLFYLASKIFFKEKEEKKVKKLQKNHLLPITGKMEDYLFDIANKYNYYTADCIYRENINTCLYKAAKEGYYKDVKIILDDYDYDDFNNALKGAAAGGRYYLFITLLDRIEDENYKFDYSIMKDVFSHENNNNILRLLFYSKNKIFEPPITNTQLKNIFINSCKFFNPNLVKEIYDDISININIEAADLNYAILKAIKYDNLPVVKYILDDLNLVLDNDIEYYLLKKSILYNSSKTLSFFIEREIGLNIPEIDYENIFKENIRYINYETINILLVNNNYLTLDSDFFDIVINPACKIDYIDLINDIFKHNEMDYYEDEILNSIDISIEFNSYDVFNFLMRYIHKYFLEAILLKILNKGDIKFIKIFIKYIQNIPDLFAMLLLSKNIHSTPEINAYIKSKIIDFLQKSNKYYLIDYLENYYSEELLDMVKGVRNDITEDDLRL